MSEAMSIASRTVLDDGVDDTTILDELDFDAAGVLPVGGVHPVRLTRSVRGTFLPRHARDPPYPPRVRLEGRVRGTLARCAMPGATTMRLFSARDDRR
jgi:hypothetical protein